jgi:hypothetical protein
MTVNSAQKKVIDNGNNFTQLFVKKITFVNNSVMLVYRFSIIVKTEYLMKRVFIILFLLLIIDSLAYAKKYYVATTGSNDSYPGTIEQPWKTWQRAFDNTSDGDTCYFRGGVYNTTTGVNAGYIGGTYSHPTCFFNYPGERPILDCYNKPTVSSSHYGIYIARSQHIYIKGLEVRNVRQLIPSMYGYGIYFYKCRGYIKVEQCVAHHCSNKGMEASGCDTIYFTNCDAFHCSDTLTTYDPGGAGSGIVCSQALNNYDDGTNAKDSYCYFKGCRAWNCSDNGIGGEGCGTIVWDSCWAINIGHEQSYDILSSGGNYNTNGNGYKFDRLQDGGKRNTVVRIMKNCIAAYCEYQGFCENSNNFIQTQIQIYNNFAYHNGFNHKDGLTPTTKYGFVTLYNSDTIGNYNHWYRNNLSHNNGNGDLFVGYNRMENNFWDDNSTVTDADFVSLDTTGMRGPRQADGSLPYTLFGHLSSTSNLIDAGTPNTDLPFKGKAPDVGWVESQPGSNMYPSVVITSPVNNSKITAPATINITVNVTDADGTISKVEFFNGATKLGERTSNSWSFTWNNVPAGTYSLTAVATDNSGAKTTSSAVSITVNTANQPPVIAISNPVTGSTFTAPATITITANASDTDGTISKVEFFNGATKLGEKTSNPWSFTWNNVPAGTYSLTAAASDNSGTKTTSSAVSIIVNNLPPVVNQPPAVTISNPTKGRKFKKHANITIDAVASDPDGTISKVEFFSGNSKGNIKLAELTTAPWSFTWKDVDVGTYSITAIATDNLNATTVSSPVDIEVEDDIITSFYDVNSEILKLYPNPNNGIFTIELIDPMQSEKSEITITSFEGKVIYNGTMLLEELRKQFDLSYIKPGFYILVLSRSEIIVAKKFIKE